MENATTASNKASLIIKIEGGVLKVVDKNGKGGGNVNIHQNKKMQFKNDYRRGMHAHVHPDRGCG